MMTKKQRLNKIYKQLLHHLVVRGAAKPAFVFGSQRSGTNMLMNVLKKHPATDCYDETDPEAFDNYVLRNTRVIDRLISDSKATLAVFKAITSSQHAGYLLNRFPAGKAVWIYRDYHDVVNSALRQFTEHRKYLWYILHDPVTAGWRREKLTQENMELIGNYYERGVDEATSRALIWYLRNLLFFQQDLQFNNRVILVNYEQMVSDPNEAFEKVFYFLGLKFKPGQAKQVFKSSIGKHTHPDIDPEVETLCGELLGKLNSLTR